MTFDYKKEYKELYLPPTTPTIISVPKISFAAVRGKGNPNEPDGEYKAALDILYAVSYTIKMSFKGGHSIEGYFPYVVPPLEGLWWQDGLDGIDYSCKEDFRFISMMRLPDFVTEAELHWAAEAAAKKKNADFSKAEFFTYDEGLCVQCMHIGSYDSEPGTISQMERFALSEGCEPDFSSTRLHHEIYLSDPRRTAEDKLKTVIRHPIKQKIRTQ